MEASLYGSNDLWDCWDDRPSSETLGSMVQQNTVFDDVTFADQFSHQEW